MHSRSSLRWRLRDATSDAHARLDAFVAPAFGDAGGYAAFLRGMLCFVDAAADATGDTTFAAAHDALTRDLVDLGLQPLVAACEPRTDAAAATGWRYVAAGSSLGARVLLPRAAALGFDAGFGAHYLALQAGGTSWRDFLAMLDGEPTPEETEAALAGARAAFACAEHAMTAAFDTIPA